MNARWIAPWAWLLPVALSTGLASAQEDTAQAFVDCAACPRMMRIDGGTFEMGAAPGDRHASEDERHVRRVRIAKSFAIGVHEVTRAQFAAFVAAAGYDTGDSCNALEEGQWSDEPGRTWRDPGFAQTGHHPVVCVSWNDAQAYVRWLSKNTGKPYRLISEAEWEYVARAGLVRSAAVSHDTANYGADKDSFAPLASGKDQWLQTAPVGSFPADSLGLHDIRGNVWEWLQDCYHETYLGAPTDGSPREQGCSTPDRKAVRGGGWGDSARLLRPTYRLYGPAAARYFSLGFRVARDLK